MNLYIKIVKNKNSYFDSENVIKNGQYYLEKKINDDGFDYKALSTIDKKIVTIKK